MSASISCIISLPVRLPVLQVIFFSEPAARSQATSYIFIRTSVSTTHARMTYVCFLCPFERECFANDIQELRNVRLSSLSGKSTSRSCRGSSFQSSPLRLLRLLQLLQQTCPSSQHGMNQYRFNTRKMVPITRRASSVLESI